MSASELAAALESVTPAKKRQRELMIELAQNVIGHLLKKLPSVPDSWDGHEIREWVYDAFAMERGDILRDKRSRRRKEYEYVLRNHL